MAKSRRIRNNKNLKRTSGGARHTRRQHGGIKGLKNVTSTDLNSDEVHIRHFTAPGDKEEELENDFFAASAPEANLKGLGLAEFIKKHPGERITVVARAEPKRVEEPAEENKPDAPPKADEATRRITPAGEEG